MKKALVGIIALVALLGGVFFYRNSAAPQELPPVDYTAAAFTKEYKNDTYKFSLSMPENFTAREIVSEEAGGTGILLESDSRSDGVQITILPFDEDLRSLTKARIEQDIPDLVITDSQTIEIGDTHTGVAFKSDNESFDGASREVWFVFRGNLYQISTYERLDPLLQKMFATWKFY